MNNKVIIAATEANSIFNKASIENKIDEKTPSEFEGCMTDVSSQIKHAAQMGRNVATVFIGHKQSRPFVRVALIELGYMVKEIVNTGYLEVKF